tara:strand:+ start:608 stop:1324 length:717 start_codon:yes stop_codon:yes gene_type:complete
MSKNILSNLEVEIKERISKASLVNLKERVEVINSSEKHLKDTKGNALKSIHPEDKNREHLINETNNKINELAEMLKDQKLKAPIVISFSEQIQVLENSIKNLDIKEQSSIQKCKNFVQELEQHRKEFIHGDTTVKNDILQLVNKVDESFEKNIKSLEKTGLVDRIADILKQFFQYILTAVGVIEKKEQQPQGYGLFANQEKDKVYEQVGNIKDFIKEKIENIEASISETKPGEGYTSP